MLVNAAQFPGPAIWQGAMLGLLPLLFFGLDYRDGRYRNVFLAVYVAIGIALFVAIQILT